MKKLEVFDPAMCCSTGVCGPTVDPKLVRPSDCPIVYGSCEKAKRAFGFEPKVSLAESLRLAWECSVAQNS